MPGSSLRFLEKSRGLTVDSIAYDLEDSVTPSKKAEGRQNVLTVLNKDRASGVREQAVRINPVASGLAMDDLTEILKGIAWSFLKSINQVICTSSRTCCGIISPTDMRQEAPIPLRSLLLSSRRGV